MIPFLIGRGDRARRLLRILSACRPNALHSVPDCALFAKNSPLDCFLRYRPSQVLALHIKKFQTQPKGRIWNFGRGDRARTCGI